MITANQSAVSLMIWTNESARLRHQEKRHATVVQTEEAVSRMREHVAGPEKAGLSTLSLRSRVETSYALENQLKAPKAPY